MNGLEAAQQSIIQMIDFGAKVALGLVFLYTNFATKKALDEKVEEIERYVDTRHEQVAGTLDEIKKTVERTDERVFHMQKERK